MVNALASICAGRSMLRPYETGGRIRNAQPSTRGLQCEGGDAGAATYGAEDQVG